jgi:hypothetical protein
MELGLKDGKVVWLKADGTPSKKLVGAKSAIAFYGFPETRGESIKILEGDPSKNEIILVTASSNSWRGTILLSKKTGEQIEIKTEDIDFAKTLVNKPRKGDYSIEKIMLLRENTKEVERQKKRDAVDLGLLEQKKGLAVWAGKSFDGFWCREYGEFNGMPDDWSILHKGDAALTRKVRKGPYWILMSKQKRKDVYYNEPIGTIAPNKNIELAFKELGGEKGAIKRRKGKEEGQRKREENMTENLKSAIISSFPKIPKKDIDDVLQTSRRSGAVGTAQWLYFRMAGKSDTSFDQAAYLAVRAHVRHVYTDYDQLLFDLNEGIGRSEEVRKEARAMVADKIENVLDSWS